MLHIFIGYDSREDMAYKVAAHSVRRHCSIPCVVTPLKIDSLKAAGKYWRTYRTEGQQRIDMADGKPFSTDFSFTRFLVPHLAKRHGDGQFPGQYTARKFVGQHLGRRCWQ